MAGIATGLLDGFSSFLNSQAFNLIIALVLLIVLPLVLIYAWKFPAIKKWMQFFSYKWKFDIIRQAGRKPKTMPAKLETDEDGSIYYRLWNQEMLVADPALLDQEGKYGMFAKVGNREYTQININRYYIDEKGGYRIGLLNAKIDDATYQFVWRNLEKNKSNYDQKKWWQDATIIIPGVLLMMTLFIMLFGYIISENWVEQSRILQSTFNVAYNTTPIMADNLFKQTATGIVGGG